MSREAPKPLESTRSAYLLYGATYSFSVGDGARAWLPRGATVRGLMMAPLDVDTVLHAGGSGRPAGGTVAGTLALKKLALIGGTRVTIKVTVTTEMRLEVV